MILIDNFKKEKILKPTSLLIAVSFVILTFSFSLQANENILTRAELAVKAENYEQAHRLFNQLANNNDLKTEALFGLARVAFMTEHLDDAEEYISDVLELSPDNPEYLFIAGRISGKQAQSASIFSKLGYASDAKQYFSQALLINKSHQPSLIGLIKFHQQAPVIAGGDKDEIPNLFDRLRAIDRSAAFSIEAPILLNENKIDKVINLYNDALNDETDKNRFRFDFAMMLSNHGLYKTALQELILIDINNVSKTADFLTMRLYQIGKLAAESTSQLALGLMSMTQYSLMPKVDKTISKDWVDFRLAQLMFLSNDNSVNQQTLIKMMKKTSDNVLKNKIKTFLHDNKQQRTS
jgi:tetratricopeptide (TPR) repeat protein